MSFQYENLYYPHPKLLFRLFLLFSFPVFKFFFNCAFIQEATFLSSYFCSHTNKNENQTNDLMTFPFLSKELLYCCTSSAVIILTADFTSIPTRKISNPGSCRNASNIRGWLWLFRPFHRGLAMLSQNIFSDEQKGLRRKVKGLASEEARGKKPRKVIADSQ